MVAAETRGVELPPTATFFSVDGDEATRCLDEHLVRPLTESLPQHAPDWRFDVRRGQEASKAVLGELFGGASTPGFLLVASHGQGIRAGDQDRQEAFQGAPVCWGKEKKGRLFHAGELDGDARLHGLITFLTACYGAGTPLEDNFPHQSRDGSLQPRPIALRSFAARLPQALLSRGALAVVGHVDRGWTLSFSWPTQGGLRAETVHSFEDVLRGLFTGQRLGHALRPLQRRYCALAARLAEMVEPQQRGEKVDERHLTMLWTAQNDARNFAVLGDPAVYLLGQRYKPEGRDAAARPSVPGKRYPRAGTEPPSVETASKKSIADTASNVTLRIVRGQSVLSYELTDPGGGVVSEKLGSVQLLEDPRSFFTGFFESIDELSFGLDEETLIDVIDAKGIALAQALLPEKLQERLWELHGRASTLQILSDETEIPWELFKLRRIAPDGQEEAFFLCEAFALTRWIPGARQRSDLPLRHPAMVVTQNANLPSVAAEQSALESLFPEFGRDVRDVPSRYVELTREMASGAYDGWHFIGHGLAHGEDPNRWKILLEDYELTPESLHGQAAGLGRGHSPLIFLNACHTARGAQSFTGVGGWASRFLELGAGAFIGASWTSRDEAAAAFAEVFYRELLNGVAIGEAVRRARFEIREAFPGDPTWLGYAAFAHPNAVCRDVAISQNSASSNDLGSIPKVIHTVPSRVTSASSNRSPRKKTHQRWGLALAIIVTLTVLTILTKTWDDLRRRIQEMGVLSTEGVLSGPKEPLGSEDPKSTEPTDPPPPPSRPPTTTTELRASEPNIKSTIAPIVSGKIGVIVVDSATGKVDAATTSAAITVLSRELGNSSIIRLSPDLPFLEDLLAGDTSSLPGSSQSPKGVEYMLIATASREALPGRGSLKSVRLAMTAQLVNASSKLVEVRSSPLNTGQDGPTADALTKATERCLSEVVGFLSNRS